MLFQEAILALSASSHFNVLFPARFVCIIMEFCSGSTNKEPQSVQSTSCVYLTCLILGQHFFDS